MNKTFDWKIAAFRVVTVGYTLFLGAFCKQYNTSHDLTLSLHDGVNGLIAGMTGGFGIDQLIFHYVKNTNNNS